MGQRLPQGVDDSSALYYNIVIRRIYFSLERLYDWVSHTMVTS
ncbi:hypothetical protein PORUE0001_0683 [Porphyromonas uenonis 60-3]|uniref:Uncharacterized protein n=1 Tax=Porphyromonas uenonis 60-3 TaxID=596327 RepID=C2MBK1_9PORP|nr:hypothetical protein [Porphyromonas uenonis]EEK16931.1 hypothetical protein PORUE0001_0683 [Porphyromonas uenonis 60-3]